MRLALVALMAAVAVSAAFDGARAVVRVLDVVRAFQTSII